MLLQVCISRVEVGHDLRVYRQNCESFFLLACVCLLLACVYQVVLVHKNQTGSFFRNQNHTPLGVSGNSYPQPWTHPNPQYRSTQGSLSCRCALDTTEVSLECRNGQIPRAGWRREEGTDYVDPPHLWGQDVLVGFTAELSSRKSQDALIPSRRRRHHQCHTGRRRLRTSRVWLR